MDKKPETVEEYINQHQGKIKERLLILRKTILEAEPTLQEKLSWGMPTFHLKENMIHFSVSKNHIGVYPGKEAVEKFKEQLTDYVSFKGTIQFPHTNPIPYQLIKEIVKYNIEN